MNINTYVTGKTKIAGVLANPIEHSISPQLHNTLSRKLGKDMIYVPLKVETGMLGQAVEGLRAISAIGFNITIPYKNEVIKYLDGLTEDARLIGAVNTIKNENGKLIGYNTDNQGFYKAFIRETGGNFTDKSVLILGAGGSARALAVKSAIEGANHITLVNRTRSKAEEIAGIVNTNIRMVADCLDPESKEFLEKIYESDVIINTTPLGMYPNTCDSAVPENALFKSDSIVCDIIYNPSETKFLAAAKRCGTVTMNGLGMLIHQGIRAYEIWHDMEIPGELVDELYNGFKEYLGTDS